MRLIDADALMEAMYHRTFETDDDTMWQSGCWVRYRAIEQVVKEQPTVNAQPSKLGQWIKHSPCQYECNRCGKIVVADDANELNYCSNCGARMDANTGALQSY